MKTFILDLNNFKTKTEICSNLISEKCPGLVTNHQIARNVELSCTKASQECSTIVGKEVYRRCSVVLEDLKNGTDQRFY